MSKAVSYGLLAEGPVNATDAELKTFVELWHVYLASLDVALPVVVVPIHKPHLVAMDPSLPKMSGASEPLDHLLARVIDEHKIESVVIAWDQHGPVHRAALDMALTAIERAGFVGVVAAGSGRYSDEADLLVLPAPNAKDHVIGPQWDMADQDKTLVVAMAMIREDVWQALAHYPHSELVSIDCTNCGQQSWYHEKDRQCPNKSINDKPLKKHPRGSRYAHGPVFPDGVEHVVVPRDYGETVWYDLAAYRDGTRKTWTEVLEHFSGTPKSEKANDAQFDKLLRSMEVAQKKEAARVAGLPAEERGKLEAERRARVEAWEAEDRDRRANPRFGDFLINDFIVRDSNRPGAWLFRATCAPSSRALSTAFSSRGSNCDGLPVRLGRHGRSSLSSLRQGAWTAAAIRPIVQVLARRGTGKAQHVRDLGLQQLLEQLPEAPGGKTKPMTEIERDVMQRLLAKHQAIRTELGGLKKTYAGSVSLRCLSLNDQCDLLEEILGAPLSYPRGTQEDR